MKIRLLILITLITFAIPSLYAQNNENSELESHNRQLITVLNQYDDFYHFGKDLFKVKKNNRWGIINGEGVIVLPIQYADIEKHELKENYFIITPENRVGIINQQGGVVIEPALYDKLGFFVGIYEEEVVIGTVVNNLLAAERNGKWGIVSENGQVMVPLNYDGIGILPSGWYYNYNKRDDIFRIDQNGKEGIISSTGEIILATDKYDRIFGADGDFIEVYIENQGYGVIDLKGNIVLSPQYKYVELYDGYAIFEVIENERKTNNNKGIINLKNRFKSEPKYYDIKILEDGYIHVERHTQQNGLILEGIIDCNGKSIVPVEYEDIAYLGNNLFEVRKEWNGDKKVINRAGTTIVSRPFDSARVKDGQLLIRRGNNFKSINPSTMKEKIIDEYAYHEPNEFVDVVEGVDRGERHRSDGVILIWDNHKYGIKDENGKELIPCKYDYIDYFINGSANANLNHKYGLIDKKDNVIIPFLFTTYVRPEDTGTEVIMDRDYYINRPKEFIYFDEGLAKKEVRRNSEGDVTKYELVSYGNANSDIEGNYNVEKEDERSYPSFPGGEIAMMKFLSNNIRYPESAAQDGVQGKVVVGFTLEADGSVSNVHIIEGVDASLDKEAMRVVKRMPKWLPGTLNGEPIRTEWSLPIGFKQGSN